MTVDDLLLLNHDAIACEELAEEVLQAPVLEVESFLATSALTELAIRRSAVVAETAWLVLTRPGEDRHLWAAALEVLFETDTDRAIIYMGEVGLTDRDLRATMAEIIAEHPGLFGHGSGAALARELAQRDQQHPAQATVSERAAVQTVLRRSG